LVSNVLTAHGGGRVALADSSGLDESDVRLAVVARDLDPLETLLGLDSLGVAGATLDARLHGPADRLVFEATGAVRSLALDGLRLVAGDFTAEGALDPGHRVETARARLGLRTLHSGAAKLHDAQVRAHWDDGALGFETTVDLDALHRASLAGTATFDSAVTRVTLDRADVRADSITWQLDHPARFAIGQDRYAVEDFAAHSQRGVVKAHGVVDRRGEQDLDVELRGVGLDFISAWLGRTDVGGLIDGTLELRGSAAEPRARGNLEATLNAEGKPAGALTSKVDWDGRRLELDGAFTPPAGSPLTLTGHLPLVVTIAAGSAPGAPTAPAPARVFEGDIDLRVQGDNVALASFSPFLDPQQVGAPEGTLDVDLRLTGPSSAVAGSGHLTIKDGAIELPALGVAYTDAQLRLELEGDRVLLREARIASKDGTLHAEGALKIASLTRVEPDLRIQAKKFEAIATKDMHVIVSGDVTVTGRLLAPIVRGAASIENTEIFLTKAMMAGANAAPEVPLTPADIRMLEEAFGPVTAKQRDLTMRLYDAADLDLAVEIARNTWVRQRTAPRLALELTGKFRLKKPPGAEPDLTGRIEPVPGHGYVEQFARKFDFTGGEILLNGPTTSHSVNIQTTYKRASSGDSGGDDVIVKLDVTGQVDQLKLTLSSEPAMSPTEIISYIATGQTRAEMATDPNSSSSASIAAQTALAQVTGRVEDVAKEAVGLDVVQIRQDAVQGATLVAGRYMSPRLYVGFRQPVQYQGNDATSTSTNYRTQVEVEYEAYQWLLMNLQGEASEINSFIRVRRAY
jgi:translocation and assembly module TamB